MRKNITVGLDMGTSVIKIVVTEFQKGDSYPRILVAEQCSSSGIKNGYIINLEDAVSSIKKCIAQTERKSGIKIKQVYLSVGGMSLGSSHAKGSIIISRADNEVSEYDVKRAISQSEDNLHNIINRTIIESSPVNFKIDGAVVLGRPLGMKGKKLEVETLFITMLTQHLDDLINVVEEAGLIINDIIASPIAESAVTLSKQQKDAGAILANIGAETVSIVVFEDSHPLSLEVFPIGSAHITYDIALGMQVSLEEAEDIKLAYNERSGSKKKISEIIEARLHDILELIEVHLKKIGRNGLLPAGVILTGSGSNLFNLQELTKNALKLPVNIGTPSFYHKDEIKKQINDAGFTIAYGLCLKGYDGKSESIRGEILRRTRGIPWRFLRNLLP